jgi:hypothetical protein
MANVKTKVDEWEVRDLEDNGLLRVYVEHNTEMGNKGVPGIQIHYPFGSIINFEPVHVERWAYQAYKEKTDTYLIADHSWMVYDDTYVKNYLVKDGEKFKARIEVKVRSKAKSIVKDYDLPFSIDL